MSDVLANPNALPRQPSTRNALKPVIHCTVIYRNGSSYTRLMSVRRFTEEELRWMWDNPSIKLSCDESGMAARIKSKITPMAPRTAKQIMEAVHEGTLHKPKTYESNDLIGNRVEFVWHCFA